MTERVCIAQIGAAHGVRGELRLKPFTDDPLGVTRYGPLETEDGKRRFEIETARRAKDMLVVRLKGVADREAAERLTNLRLYVARARLPKPADDEFYYADLIGLAAVTADGATFGTVKAMHNFGAGDLLEIEPASGGNTLLLQFTAAVVPVVDIKGGKVVITPPDESVVEGEATDEANKSA